MVIQRANFLSPAVQTADIVCFGRMQSAPARLQTLNARQLTVPRRLSLRPRCMFSGFAATRLARTNFGARTFQGATLTCDLITRTQVAPNCRNGQPFAKHDQWERPMLERDDWLGVWSGLTHCGKCHALMSGSLCPFCGDQISTDEWMTVTANGRELRVRADVREGALSWTAHSLLGLMRREWQRPLSDENASGAPLAKQCSERVLVVILFWTLFEHLMDQFFRTAVSRLPARVATDLMKRYQTIGSRLDRLYTMLFEARLGADLEMLGYGVVFTHVQRVQDCRNAFVHGRAEAIDDALVRETIERLPEVQAAWLALFNLRCTGDPSAPRIYEDHQHREVLRHGAKRPLS
jgi:hypothetical protein